MSDGNNRSIARVLSLEPARNSMVYAAARYKRAPYVLDAGAVIPSARITRLRSDLPG